MDNTILLNQIEAARLDVSVADEFISSYLPFIKSETSKFIKRAPIEGQDDELGIAMFAFYESILSYEQSKGAFFSLAAMHIKHRLIDFYRKENRHNNIISLDAPSVSGDDSSAIMDDIADSSDDIAYVTERNASQAEIEKYTAELSMFGISLSEVAETCPKQERTLLSCLKVLNTAKQHPELIDIMLSTNKLPISKLSSYSNVDSKILERHRRYIIAIILAYTNGFDLIREHINALRTERR